MVERMNRTLLDILRTLPRYHKSNWPESVSKMTHAYNCTKHSVTGFSPFYLMFGREPLLPIDLLKGTNEDITVTKANYQKFIDKWKTQMEQAYAIANRQTLKRREKDSEKWNQHKLVSELQIRDRTVTNSEKDQVQKEEEDSIFKEAGYS